MDGRRVAVIGATGMVGGLVTRRAGDSATVASVTAVGRRPSGIAHPKLVDVVHDDFLNFAALEPILAGIDIAFFCVGVYSGTASDEELRRITVDCPVAFAESLRRVRPDATFCLLSGLGADPSGRSRLAYARYKGAAERAILALGFPRVHTFRPGYIYPVTRRREPNVSYRVLRALYPLARRFYPNVGVSSESLAAAMLHVGLDARTPPHEPVLENRDIRRVAAGLGVA